MGPNIFQGIVRYGLLSVASGLCVTAAAQGQNQLPTDVELTTAIGFSDNVGLDFSPKIDSLFIDVGLNADWARKSDRSDVYVRSNAVYRTFEDAQFDNLVLGDFDLGLTMSLVPGSLLWNFKGEYGQVRTSEVLAADPENIQDVFDIGTGPTWLFSAGSRGQFDVTATYDLRNFEKSDSTDSERVLFRAGYQHLLSPNRSIGVTAVTRSIVFSEDDSLDVDIDSLFTTYSTETARGSFLAELGFDRSRTDIGSDEGIRIRLEATRQLAAYTSVLFGLGRQLSESGDLLSGTGNNVFDRTDRISAINSAVQRSSADLQIGVDRPRMDFSFGVAWIDDEYETARSEDIERFTGTARVSRTLSRSRTLTLSGLFLRRDFPVLAERNDEWRANLTLAVLRGRAEWSVRIGHRRLNATNREDFAENQVQVSYAFVFSSSSRGLNR